MTQGRLFTQTRTEKKGGLSRKEKSESGYRMITKAKGWP